ncbi:hypothetical protein [Massilia niastensis]|uniref:hypothetical protein n=1 Tax=Massilia niastensis TaxID=544911 RepID=UPI0003A32F33|nr:hypothetical protein [Massilia niastensis]
MKPSSFLLRARLALGRVNPLAAGALVLVAAGAFTQAWLLPARERLALEYEEARRAARAPLPAAPPAPPPPDSDQNLADFYAALGERARVERQLKDVFALAAKNGLALQQGEYRSSYDRNAKVFAYQANLPVKGGFAAIWQFALDILRALPHASLDDVSFRRDTIGDANVEARLRLTLYLSPRSDAAPAGGQP